VAGRASKAAGGKLTTSQAATGSLTLLYFNFKGWGNQHRDYLYVAAMCTQAAMPIYMAPLLGAPRLLCLRACAHHPPRLLG
jgi:hypothetical protein